MIRQRGTVVIPWVALFALVVFPGALLAQEAVLRESEATGFKMTNLTVQPCRQDVARIQATVRNTTEWPVKNVVVYLVLRNHREEEIRKVVSVIDPPLPLKPGSTGEVNIPVLTDCQKVHAVEYKIVGIH